MSLKDKIINAITAHPKIATLGIGFAITFAIGTTIGMFDHNVSAMVKSDFCYPNEGCYRY